VQELYQAQQCYQGREDSQETLQARAHAEMLQRSRPNRTADFLVIARHRAQPSAQD
jgi:hypothetical protein